MHPVQAAPRQSPPFCPPIAGRADAPRAGSAEAKFRVPSVIRPHTGCTPCRQRRGKELCRQLDVGVGGCTPCRQRRGKAGLKSRSKQSRKMHPVQAAPRQRRRADGNQARCKRCTPCRQRRGKELLQRQLVNVHAMHPVQAAPRQSVTRPIVAIMPRMHPVQAAPRQRRLLHIWLPPVRMHPVQAAPRQRSRKAAILR